METITPRWEWRMFGSPPPAAEAAFRALEPQGTKDSDERYLLARDDRIVKVRDELMDIKVLVATDEHGLQQWRPVMKASFPLQADAVTAVSDALGAVVVASRGEGLTLADLLAELQHAGSDVLAAPVHKHRVRYVVEGCAAEDSTVEVKGHSLRTIAIESEDAAAVWAAVRSVGMGGYRNTSYARGLRSLLRRDPLSF